MKVHITKTYDYPLKEKMYEKRFTIRGLGKKANVHYTYISKLLSGHSACSEDILQRIQEALDDTKYPGICLNDLKELANEDLQ